MPNKRMAQFLVIQLSCTGKQTPGVPRYFSRALEHLSVMLRAA